MANKADVLMGGYAAEISLAKNGDIQITIPGAKMTRSEFKLFVQARPNIHFIGFQK